jgi:hypothetical protein
VNRFAKNKQDDQSNISTETLYDYFKHLNTNIDNDNNNIDIDINIDSIFNVFVEYIITASRLTIL